MPRRPAHTSRRPISHRPSRKVIREFNDRGTLWLLEDPVQLQGLLQILDPTLAVRLDFAHAERINRSFIPVLLYTGTVPWIMPIGLAHLMDLPAELEPFTPRWETLFLNLHAAPPDTLTRFATAVGWALRVLQAERAPRAEMERVLTEAMAGLEGLTEEQSGQWLRVAWFLVLFAFHRRGEEEMVELIRERAQQSKFRQKKELATMGQTIAQRIAEQATREALETVLRGRFGPVPDAIRQRLATADAETMKRWLETASRASNLEEVGILSQEPGA